MEVQIIENIEFGENKCEDVVLLAEVKKTRHDGTFIEDVYWESDRYSDEENNHISIIANSNKMTQRFFKAFDAELQEQLLESNI